ncbi:vanadium-dependent haloperoxidase [Marivirga arenosa]|uniref:Vanadium-dependent haloperoxidase n=1 Tax=Marivirga arenosa TaxID=3059076 RepID=A0AA52F060_9BACT|nr:vanadium-dependent haloperoxidase [Marivirga sp. BKB1-2]WNB17889.1 vanadium-dependent haloperoxidase [Marivirga sp. BKB1-2]
MNPLKTFLLIASMSVYFLCPQSIIAQKNHNNYTPFMFTSSIFMEGKEPNEQTIDSIFQLQSALSSLDLEEIKYWNSAYPNYRWHQLLMDISNAHKGHKNGARVVIMHLAIYDALATINNYSTDRTSKRPFELNPDVKLFAKNKNTSSLCEWSAAAGAASQIISYYFPDQSYKVDSCLQSFKLNRLRSGTLYAKEINASIEVGKKVAAQYIAYAKTNRTADTWEGEVPIGKNKWKGIPSKWDPMKAKWKPLTLDSNDQFRPGPPPSDWEAEMQELREFQENHKRSNIAWKWRTEPVWDDLLERKILEYDLNPMQAAYASALFHASRYEATIVAWDGKYHYWTIRPFQYDPGFKPYLIDTPNFPGYPAGHTTVAGSVAEALSYIFPLDHKEFELLAEECSESRFEGGVHFRTDNEVGLEIGSQVGEFVIKRFQKLSPR